MPTMRHAPKPFFKNFTASREQSKATSRLALPQFVPTWATSPHYNDWFGIPSLNSGV